MTIDICIPSYRRPDGVLSFKIFKSAKYFVAEAELEAYRKHNEGMNLVPVPDAVQGNVARVRNFILDHREADAILMVDDDFKWLGSWIENKRRYIEDEGEILGLVERFSIVCEEAGARMWGVNLNSDKLVYREYTPFSFLSPVLGPFSCHLDHELRYDERIPLKEDYDMFLQQVQRFRRVFRVNRLHYENLRAAQPGGCSNMRNTEVEKKQFALLQKKWGSRIVQKPTNQQQGAGSKKQQSYDINPLIQVPIPGV